MGTFWGFITLGLALALAHCALTGDRRGVVDLLTIASVVGLLLYLRSGTGNDETS